MKQITMDYETYCKEIEKSVDKGYGVAEFDLMHLCHYILKNPDDSEYYFKEGNRIYSLVNEEVLERMYDCLKKFQRGESKIIEEDELPEMFLKSKEKDGK